MLVKAEWERNNEVRPRHCHSCTIVDHGVQWAGISDGHGRVARKEPGIEARGCGLSILVKNQDFSPKSFGEPLKWIVCKAGCMLEIITLCIKHGG